MPIRMEMTPEDGLLMSRPGVDVTETDKNRLMDPRFPSLEVHWQSESNSLTRHTGGSVDDWTLEVPYPGGDMGYVPIGFIEGVYAFESDIVNYPATMLPPSRYYVPPLGTYVYLRNYYEIRSDGLWVLIRQPEAYPSPYVRWTIFKNPQVMV